MSRGGSVPRLARCAVALAVAATLFAILSPAAAEARVAAPQKEEGNVLLPAPGPNGETTGGCWTGLGRRAWVLSAGQTAGPFGSMFEIDSATWNGKFELEVTGGAMGTEDLDITFYADPAGVNLPDTGPNGTGSYLTRKPGGEVGKVPPGSNVALICLGIGSGANIDYSYTATPPKKKKKPTAVAGAPDRASTVRITFTVDLMGSTPASRQCSLEVTRGSDGIDVLQAAVDQGCITSYQVSESRDPGPWPGQPPSSQGRHWLRCIDAICDARAYPSGGVPETKWSVVWDADDSSPYWRWGLERYSASRGDVFVCELLARN